MKEDNSRTWSENLAHMVQDPRHSLAMPVPQLKRVRTSDTPPSTSGPTPMLATPVATTTITTATTATPITAIPALPVEQEPNSENIVTAVPVGAYEPLTAPLTTGGLSHIGKVSALSGRFTQVIFGSEYYYGVLQYEINKQYFTIAGKSCEGKKFPLACPVVELQLKDIFGAPCFPSGGPSELNLIAYADDAEFAPDLRSFTPPSDRELRYATSNL